RLDLAEWAMRKRDGHRDAIVPGHPEKSELVNRIESKDPHYLMPQDAQGDAKPMSAGEIAILTEWIKQGAVYRPHWAFEAPVRPPVPQDGQADGWAKNAIDNFIFEIAILTEWIKQGAVYRPHWAVEAPVRPPVPQDGQADGWAKNAIDNFIF